MHKIVPIFPTPVYVATLDKLEESAFKTLSELEYQKQVIGENYFSHNTNVLDLPILSSLRKSIEDNLEHYLTEVMCGSNSVSLEITQSWVNINPPNTFHSQHMHNNSVVSGVFYIHPDNLPSMVFHREPVHGISVADPNVVNMFNSPDFRVSCESGMLVLFPSNVLHSVEQNVSSGSRMSLAFNTYVKGTIGNKYSLNLLEL
jgi:uncharacterized protein (TIGR02466 family)